MKKFVPYAFVASALLALGACNSENKPVETTAVDTSPSGDTAVVMTDATDVEAVYRMRGRKIADRVYNDMKLTDTTVRSRLATVYMGRARRIGGLRAQPDTTGQYQAMRQAEMETETELKTIFVEPKMYQTYEQRRADYSDDKYADMSTTPTGTTGGSMEADGRNAAAAMATDAMNATDGDKAKLKLKGEDGSKIKIKKGDIKVKDADGEKTKINGD